MRRFKYAYSALVYYGEDIGASIDRVARFGYDGIELLGQPETYDAPAVAAESRGRGHCRQLDQLGDQCRPRLRQP